MTPARPGLRVGVDATGIARRGTAAPGLAITAADIGRLHSGYEHEKFVKNVPLTIYFGYHFYFFVKFCCMRVKFECIHMRPAGDGWAAIAAPSIAGDNLKSDLSTTLGR